MSAGHHKVFHPDERMLRHFAILWVIFFGGLAAWNQFYSHRETLAMALAVLSVTVGPIGLVWPRAIRPVFLVWMILAYPIGWTVSRLVLGVLFYGLFTPIGVVFRLIGRDELGLKKQPAAASYWQQKRPADDKAQYLRQF
jgi:hypothetical protein